MYRRLTFITCMLAAAWLLVACGAADVEPSSSQPQVTPDAGPALQPVETAVPLELPTASPTPLTPGNSADDQLTIATEQSPAGYPSDPVRPPVVSAAYPESTPQLLRQLEPDAYPPGSGAGRILEGDVTSQPANVEQLTLTPIETFPFQLEVLVEGTHPDPCWTVTKTTQTREGNTLRLDVTASREAEAMCAQVLEPFSHTYLVDINGLPQGVYIIDANGVTSEFVLPVDNFQR